MIVSSRSLADASPIGNENLALFLGLVKTSCIGFIGLAAVEVLEPFPTDEIVLLRLAAMDDEILIAAEPGYEAELILVLI